MRILQPADWSKPRGFSHGVAIDGPGRWIVLAGQTGGDEKGEYQPDMAGQVGVALRRIVKLLNEAGAGPEHIVRLTWYLTSRRIRGGRLRHWCGLARDARAKFSTLDVALHRWPGRCPRQGRDRSHRVCPNRVDRKREGQIPAGSFRRLVGGN